MCLDVHFTGWWCWWGRFSAQNSCSCSHGWLVLFCRNILHYWKFLTFHFQAKILLYASVGSNISYRWSRSSYSMKFFVVKYFFGESTQNRSFLWRYPNLKLHVYTNHSRDSVPNFFFWHLHVINKVRSNFRVNRSILCVFKGLRR